jgi:hypothetical protein
LSGAYLQRSHKAHIHAQNIVSTISGQGAPSVNTPVASQTTVNVNSASQTENNSSARGMYCPSCQNLNPIGANNCLKCQLSFI